MRICDLIRALFIASLPIAAAAGKLMITPGLYEISAQTVMPHLEEMRRKTVHDTRCLNDDNPAAIFPVMDQRALKGCELGFMDLSGDVFHYTLSCQSTRVATGTAELRAAPDRIVGKLEVKMGGKNMTFSQFVKATWKAECQRRSGSL